VQDVVNPYQAMRGSKFGIYEIEVGVWEEAIEAIKAIFKEE